MAYTKASQFQEDEIELARIAKSVSHPARIAILKHLAATQSCICGDLVDVLPLSQSTVSQHLKALKEADLIKGDVDGPKVCYCLNLESCEKALQYLSQLFQGIKCC